MENYAALGDLLSQIKETSQDLHQGPSEGLQLAGIISERERGERGKKNSPQPTADQH